MAISKNKYVEKFYPAFAENPRKFLAGHKIVQKLKPLFTAEEADGKVLDILLRIGHGLKGATKGAMALKKANNLLIKTYVTEGALIDNIADDSAAFVAGLSPQDAEQFENAENIHVIGYFPGFEKGSPVQLLKLNTLLRNGYRGKFGKGHFIIVMFGNSAVRTTELKLAKVKAKVNAKKAKRITSPTVLKARMKKKAMKKINKLNSRIADKASQAAYLQAEMEEFNSLAGEFGLDGSFEENAGAFKMATSRINRSTKATLDKMTDAEKAIWSIVKDYMKSGNKRAASALVKKSKSKAIEMLYSGNDGGADAIIGARGKALRSQGRKLRKDVKTLRDRIGNWEIDRADAKALGDLAEYKRIGKNIASAKHRIGKINTKLRDIKAKLGMNKMIASGDYNAKSLKSKAEILANVNLEMQEMTAAGATQREALQAGLAKIDADAATKQAIKQNAEAAMQEGIPVQIAVQQAIQQEVTTSVDSPVGGEAKALLKNIL